MFVVESGEREAADYSFPRRCSGGAGDAGVWREGNRCYALLFMGCLLSLFVRFIIFNSMYKRLYILTSVGKDINTRIRKYIRQLV